MRRRPTIRRWRAALAAADLIHLPGGDPDLIPALYPGTAAWAAHRAGASRGGAVLAGASAGAMALGSITWTPRRAGRPASGSSRASTVVPHADDGRGAPTSRASVATRPTRLGVLGLAERTGRAHRGRRRPWRVVGEGEVRWLARRRARPVGRRSSCATATRSPATGG